MSIDFTELPQPIDHTFESTRSVTQAIFDLFPELSERPFIAFGNKQRIIPKATLSLISLKNMPLHRA
jgi:hypothetical protein